ncbi:amidase, partial [Mycolicibacterium porcinum]|uniref:amidase n=1 Tax=Mycolicibacterium porcinum TaxID=39693 RepID=UPI0034CDA6DA
MSFALTAQGNTAVEIADAVRAGEISVVETVRAALGRVESHDDEIGAFVHVDVEGALARAEALDRLVSRGVDPGPLAGVPLGVKELHPVAGWPFAMGSALYADRVADHTCTLVNRAVAAGAVPIGLTASPEFGRASYTASELHGVTRNPWNPRLTPGGSSGGSAAAVAAGMVPIATGTDGAGSLRIPASYCALVGFKTTYGLVPRGPRHRGAADNDHYGALTRTVRDTARFLDCVCGLDPYDRASLPAPGSFENGLNIDLRGLRVAFAADLGNAPCDPAVAEVAHGAAERFIAEVGAARVSARLRGGPARGGAGNTPGGAGEGGGGGAGGARGWCAGAWGGVWAGLGGAGRVAGPAGGGAPVGLAAAAPGRPGAARPGRGGKRTGRNGSAGGCPGAWKSQ